MPFAGIIKEDRFIGRGNVHPDGPYEWVYYIDRDYTAVYRKVNAADDDMDDRKLRYWFGADSPEEKGWEYDECESIDEEDYDLRLFSDDFMNLFPDFSKTNENISRTRRAILESPLFYVAVEDNEWSTAVELIQKDTDSDLDLNSQNALYRIYLDAMKNILLRLFPSIGTYAGPWTHWTLTK